jgi:hypothetical protein
MGVAMSQIHSRFRQFEHGGVDRIRDLEMSWTGEGIDAMEVIYDQ